MFTHIESEREKERKIKNEKKKERDRGNKKDRKKRHDYHNMLFTIIIILI